MQAEKHSTRYQQEANLAAEELRSLAVKKKELYEKQREETQALRQVLKQSLDDQRKWFELQVQGNRIIAIGPATSDSAEVTARVVEIAERITGLDGHRLRHFLTPIKRLELAP